mgnify:CR=1 FL=1
MKKLIYAVCLLALLGGCTQTKKTAPQEGRIAVQTKTQTPLIQKENSVIELSEPTAIQSWNFTFNNAENNIPHAKINGFDKKVWDENVGKGISGSQMSLSAPVTADGLIYTLDSRLRLTQTNAEGDVIWDLYLRPDNTMPAIASVGLAYEDGLIYAVSGDGIVYAVVPQGDILWQYDTKNMLRSAPTVKNNRLYVLGTNNELIVLNTKDGSIAWSYKNMETTTNLLGMGQPAVSNGIIVVPFSSGEIIAFNEKTGELLWSNTLLSYRTFNQIADLSHVLASPVIDNNTVYLIGNAHQMGAFNLKTGKPIFVNPIGGQTTPVIVGNSLFMITNKDTLIAMDKHTGSIFWEKDLYSQTEKRVAWHTPIPANNQLIVTSGEGDVIVFDMQTGTEIKKTKIEKLFVAPIAYSNGLLFYTNNADLIMYR